MKKKINENKNSSFQDIYPCTAHQIFILEKKHRSQAQKFTEIRIHFLSLFSLNFQFDYKNQAIFL